MYSKLKLMIVIIHINFSAIILSTEDEVFIGRSQTVTLLHLTKW